MSAQAKPRLPWHTSHRSVGPTGAWHHCSEMCLRFLPWCCSDKPLGVPVVELQDVSKSYPLEGGGTVTALKSVTLHSSSGFYPIRRGEFVMVRVQCHDNGNMYMQYVTRVVTGSDPWSIWWR